MRKIKPFIRRFENEMTLSLQSERLCFRITFCLLIIYLECVIFAQNTVIGVLNPAILMICAISVVFFCYFGVRLFHRINAPVDSHRSPDIKHAIYFGILIFLATFLMLFIWQLAYWPGGFSADSFQQYEQIVNGAYNDWHPVLHTWLFFYTPYQIFGSASGIITLQLCWYSLAVAYLFYVLYRNHCSKWYLISSWLYIVLNPVSAKLMLHPWKDGAMTIFAVVVFSYLVQIYLSKGAWLKSWYNILLFSIMAFLATNMRHNAFLLIVPAYIVLLVFMKNIRKMLLFSIVLVIALSCLLKGPVYTIAGVEEPGQRQTEMLGLPITILSNVYMNDRDALSAEAESFMNSLATQEEWEEHYVTGNFNFLKWNSSQDIGGKIESEGTTAVLNYTIDAILHSHLTSWMGFAHLTKMVWSFDGGDGWGVGVSMISNKYGIAFTGNTAIKSILDDYSLFISTYVTKYLYHFLGGIILVLLFTAIGRIGRSPLANVLMVLPPMVYNFGTMLLLTGPDFRFFHYNFVIVVPLLFILLQDKKTTQEQEEEDIQ